MLETCFFHAAFEYEDRINELHSIAKAIRMSKEAFVSLFRSPLEDNGFPERILLGHLYNNIEQSDGAKLAK